MTAPPKDLKDWSKKALVREVERLRAVLYEHGQRRGDDPRRLSKEQSIIDVAGDPHAHGGVVIDARSAVLMESVDVSLVDLKSGDVGAMMLALSGRVNMTDDRVEHAYLMGGDGAAAIVSELIGLAQRASKGPGPAQAFAADFKVALEERLKGLPDGT